MIVRHELLMPKLGLTMTEGMVADWMVQPGQTMKPGSGVFVVETDKVANEIPAEQDGTLVEIVVPTGTTVPVGTVIGYWEDGNATAATAISTSSDQQAGNAPATPTAATTASDTESFRPSHSLPTTASRHDSVAAPGHGGSVGSQDHGSTERIIATPLARRLAKERGLSLAPIQGSGPKGRIVARDVHDHVPAPQASPPSATNSTATVNSGYTVIAPTTLQSTIARRLTKGKQDTPHFYLALDAEVSRLVALRKEINQAQQSVRLTLNHFIVMAVVRALQRTPDANRVWSDEGILAFNQIDVGVAVNTDQGLMAPAVRDVGNVSIGELARRLDAVAASARNATLSSQDMGTPAITVSNAGMHNVTYMSSIINPGQAMILGVGSVKGVFRPDDGGQPVLCQEMGLVLSADHRIMDGVSALKFLNTVAQLLAQPSQLLVN